VWRYNAGIGSQLLALWSLILSVYVLTAKEIFFECIQVHLVLKVRSPERGRWCGHCYENTVKNTWPASDWNMTVPVVWIWCWVLTKTNVKVP
jgi:hypothetical protein